jgi:hypothetical protein
VKHQTEGLELRYEEKESLSSLAFILICINPHRSTVKVLLNGCKETVDARFVSLLEGLSHCAAIENAVGQT